MLENFLISLFFVLLNFSLAIILRTVHKTWLAPSAIYALWWSVTSLGSIIAGFKETIAPVGLIWILLSSILVGAGSLVMLPKREITIIKNERVTNPLVFIKIDLKRLYLTSLLLSFLYIFASLYYQQTSISDLFSIDNILLMAAKFSQERYQETNVLPIYVKLLLPFVFFANCIGGAMFGTTRKYLFSLSLIPPVIISILFTEKASVFFCFSFWIASLMAILLLKKQFRLFSFRTIAKLFVIGITVLLILILSSFARLGSLDLKGLSVVGDKLYSSIFGHIPAFSNWLLNFDFSNETLSFGKFTFAGIFDFFGISERLIGLYTVNYQLSNGELTNIYSIHKGLILDFSILGALSIYFFFGLVSAFLFHCVEKGRYKYIGLLSGVYTLIFVSIFTSIFVYNTTFLAIVLAVLLFILI